MAKNKFKYLVHTGEWNTPPKEQKEILAWISKLGYITKKEKLEKIEKCNE